MTEKDLPRKAAPAPRWTRRLTMALGGILVLAACVAIRCCWEADPAGAAPQQTAAQRSPTALPVPAKADTRAASPAANPTPLKVVATVNGEDVTREDLARECLRHYGEDVLESLVNKYLIISECQRLGVSVTQEETNREVERIARRFGLPVDQWLKMLKQERGIGPTQYASDIIWPTLALRKLAGEQLQISKDELLTEFELHYGPAVKARIIVCQTAEKAEKVRAVALAKPAEFGNLAKDQSEDPTSASLKGMIQPIRRHMGNNEIEQVAFSMKDGEISPVIQIASQHVILQREGEIPAREVRFQDVQPQMEELIRDRKLKSAANQIFQRLQDEAGKQGGIVNVINDPQKSRQMPGVAAVINGHQITVRELADRCIERHGEEVLEGTLNRRLLEQGCRRKNVAVTEADIDQEIARAAAAMLTPRPDGKPDVETWLGMVTKQQGVSVDVYRHDSVWPSVALRKLVGDRVQVTEDDLQRGFEANYGPRVRCRAIVLDNLRRAQQVWEMAKQNPSVGYFGELAAQFSVEGGSRALKGEVPPIQKHGGQPLLEKEAFALKKGELSSIIEVEGNKYVILLCEGYTEPQKVDFKAVRDLIFEDVHEKKLRLAMGDCFQQLQDEATIDNYLAGSSRVPKRQEKTAGLPVKSASRSLVPVRPPATR